MEESSNIKDNDIEFNKHFSLRDVFAAVIVHAIITSKTQVQNADGSIKTDSMTGVAQTAYDWADKMLKARGN